MNRIILPPGFNKKKRRPVGPGVSIGHPKAKGGTFGAVVRQRKTGELLILSNNHVLANCSGVLDARAKSGDPVLQPSASDGGIYTKMIGRLLNWVPLKDTVCNLVDAAVAKPLSPSLISYEVRGIGRISGTAAAVPGMRIKKVGHTTGLTRGEITEVNYSVTVPFAEKEYLFCDQLAARLHCREGDSGSIVVDDQNRAVGLLFAVQDGLGIINRIEHVMLLLNIEFV
ncbi:MAG: trypsin-like peptidase domain-containing protein [Bacillota bacterium]|nr:trypsin-like peptidase domain-containing protein [Bacillota bacterium]MDD3298038.1 trypsin-like peptidase domain-containing protein [Bacillota bacterium]MDD3850487.1 trypsin-like peptidase domain-containing protein [Bacillota bacterium]MDD4707717.1 trypsin-like peptidase domain-containing protein [Bacillota bacterium]